MGNGYALEILLSNDHTVVHHSEHETATTAMYTLGALGYPEHTITDIADHETGSYFGLTGHDHLYVKVSRLDRRARPTYDFVITVRITGTRDGWSRTILDTPKFVLVSNAQFGSIYTWTTARSAVYEMFRGLTEPEDSWHVSIHPFEHSACANH